MGKREVLEPVAAVTEESKEGRINSLSPGFNE